MTRDDERAYIPYLLPHPDPEDALADHLWTRLTRGMRRIFASAAWPRFAGADWAERILNVEVTDRFHAKQGRSIGRWTLTEGGDRLVVYLKRHYRLPWWHGLMAALRPSGNWSPAMAEYHNLKWAREQGLPVPATPAVAEFLGPGGRLQSMLAVEELTGMLPLHEAVPLAFRGLPPIEFAKWKAGLTAEMVRLTRMLHDRSHFHKDLYFCHFYIAEADTRTAPERWRERVVMIDFHRLGRHRLAAAWWQAKDLGQLLYSSDVEGVTPRDRLRFWKLYCPNETFILRWVRRLAELRARTNHRHNRK